MYPQRKHIRLPADAYHKPGTWYFVTICCRERKPLFESTDQRTLIEQVLRQTAIENHVELAAYTILPNHLHVIGSAGDQGLPAFVRAFKSRPAMEFRHQFESPSPWQPRYFDHKIRSHESLRQKCEYVWQNPVRKGLATTPEEYRWSGALLSG